MSEDFANKLLDSIPEGDAYKSLRGMIGLYLDKLLTREQLETQKVYVSFVQQHQELISNLLYDEQFEKKEYNEIKNVHFNHHTSHIFEELGNKAAESGNTEYCKIKLADASGMTEFPQTVSRHGIINLLEDLLSTQKNLTAREKTIDLINRTLVDNGLLERAYPEESVYRIGVALSSKKEICLSIEHDSKKNEYGFNGYMFSLSSDRKVIVDILERFGYNANNAIEQMFGPIIIVKKGDIDDEDYDYV